ncbi:MAG: zinc carboxypeptidase, partial [Candidatus Eisenbacteria bacterium]|nr:zinc carboxypeptidase [Candidatus Eisenbacteria bacterium]
YASRQAGKRDYGVWHTYAETVAELNLLHSQYPNLTTAPFSLGPSIEGREIWAIKVSDNPNVDEDEPEVLHDGVHHAREIMTVEMCLYAWITGQNSGGYDGTDDVDTGAAATRSPDYDLSAYPRVRLKMDYFHGQRDTGDDPADHLKFCVSPDAGASWINLITVGDVATAPEWRARRKPQRDIEMNRD